MDSEDVLFTVAAVLIAGGAAYYSPGAGLICLGAMLAIGPLLSMWRASSRKGDE